MKLNKLEYHQLQKLANKYGVEHIKEVLKSFDASKSSNGDRNQGIQSELEKGKCLIRQYELEVEIAEKQLEASKNKLETSKFNSKIRRRNHIENIFWRFPDIGEQMFEELDDINLVKCRKVSILWNKSVDDTKTLWIRQIQEFASISNSDGEKTLRKENLKTLQNFAKISKKSYDLAKHQLAQY